MAKAQTAVKGGKAKSQAPPPEETGPVARIPLRLKERYHQEIRKSLMERFKYRNVMQVPRLEKVVVNMGLGEAIANPKILEGAVADLMAITGQRPVVTKARKSISNFKLRAGAKIGAKVTLRGERMWSFLDRLFNIVLPRIRDFRGLSARSFDGRGNYALGLKEQIIFPEIDYDKVDKVRGMDIIIVTTARSDEEGAELLRLLGCPLRTQ
jgi:large subunit ribosomal protein L5